MSAYINKYLVTLGYGGAEEGGWWYQIWEPLSSLRIRGSIDSHKARHRLNIERKLHCFHTSRQRAFYTREDCIVRRGSPVYSDLRPREEGGRCWSSFGQASSTRGVELLLTLEDHPAQARPTERPRYE